MLSYIAFNHSKLNDEIRLEFRVNDIPANYRDHIKAFKDAMQSRNIVSSHARVYAGVHCIYQGQLGGLV